MWCEGASNWLLHHKGGIGISCAEGTAKMKFIIIDITIPPLLSLSLSLSLSFSLFPEGNPVNRVGSVPVR